MQQDWEIPQDMDGEPTVGLRHYWSVVSQYKWRILALAGAASVLAVLVVFAMAPVYTATADLLIESQDANILSIEGLYQQDVRNQQYYDTQFEILNSRPLVEQVIADLDILQHPEYKAEEKSGAPGFNWRAWLPFQPEKSFAGGQSDETLALGGAVSAYYGNLAIQPVGRTQLVKIQFSSEDPVLAADVANAHAQAYIDSMLDARHTVHNSAATLMSDQLDGLQSKMLESEAQLQKFREQEQLIDVEGLKSLPAREINELSLRLVKVRSELSQARIVYTQVYQGQSRPLDDLSGMPAVLEDRGVQGLQQAEAEAEQKVAEIANVYGPKHSVMIAAQSELANATENLRNQQRSVAKSIRSEFEAARAEEAELVKALDRAKQEYQEIGRKESGLMALQRESETNRSLYELFYNRFTETAATGDLKSAPARIIAPAVIPLGPAGPKKGFIVALVFMLSLLVGVVAAFMLESINITIRTAQEAERLNVPLLGMLPLLKPRRKRQTSMGHVFFDSSETEFNEAIRTVRTGITLNSLDNPNRVMLVTSSLSGEGKSTVALNLAFAFSRMEKVLLIDADMRQPSIAKEFGLPLDSPGLSELISGKARFSQCVMRRKKENLDVIAAGVVSENPSERLSAHRCKQLLQALRTRYDRIIIDSPPLLPVSDSAVLANYADLVVFVVKSDSTTVQQAQDALKKLHLAKGTIAGVLINQLDMKRAGYAGYGYGSYASDLPQEVPAVPKLRVVK